jgi:hypothetical protein
MMLCVGLWLWFMVITLTVGDMFIGKAARKRIVRVVRAVCVWRFVRGYIHFVLRNSDVGDASEFNLCRIAFTSHAAQIKNV